MTYLRFYIFCHTILTILGDILANFWPYLRFVNHTCDLQYFSILAKNYRVYLRNLNRKYGKISQVWGFPLWCEQVRIFFGGDSETLLLLWVSKRILWWRQCNAVAAMSKQDNFGGGSEILLLLWASKRIWKYGPRWCTGRSRAPEFIFSESFRASCAPGTRDLVVT